MNESSRQPGDKWSSLFRRTASTLKVLSEERLVPLDAAVIDIDAAVRKISSEILPTIDKMSAERVTEMGDLLDLLMDLKVEFEHIQNHLAEALPALDDLLSEVARLEESSHGSLGHLS